MTRAPTLDGVSLPLLARLFADLCAADNPHNRASLSFGDPTGSWIVVVGLTTARSAELERALTSVLPGETDPIVSALRDRVAEMDATIADLRAQVAEAVTDTRAKIGAFLRGFEAASYDLSESDYAEAIEEGTYEEGPMVKPLSVLLAEAEAKGRRQMREAAAVLVKGMADPCGAVTMNPAPITADRIACSIRALPDTAPERTGGEG